MRPIKFRAWHKADEKMYQVYGFTTNQWFLRGKNFPMPLGAIELMQWTGLVDKNGKEIYEGDIIKIEHPFKGRSYVGPIVYQTPRFTAKDFYFTHHDDPSDPFESLRYIEVIGNTYQNPDLLGSE